MKIVRARRAGFCFGVERAIAIAREALAESNDTVYSLGPIIHNPQVVRELEVAGLKVVNSLESVPRGTVIIRSHGVPSAVYEEVAKRKLAVLDTTCPFVKKMHNIAIRLAEEGYKIILLGDREHPEITSLLGEKGFKPLVVNSSKDLKQKQIGKKVGLLSQTTQSVELFQKVAQALLPLAKELRIFNTICDSTRLRQEESLDVAMRVNVMIIIGGRNSANTKRLFHLCKSTGTPSYHVEVPEEVSCLWMKRGDVVGVTAGASTPMYLIEKVVDKIKSLNIGEK